MKKTSRSHDRVERPARHHGINGVESTDASDTWKSVQINNGRMKVNRFDGRKARVAYSGVDQKDAIHKQLQKWGVKSPEDRRVLTRAIQSAAARVTNPLKLPKPGDVTLYNDRHNDPALAGTDVIEFMRGAWGKWMKARVLTRKFYRDYDPAGERALRYWLVINRTLPDDLYVPTNREINDDLILAGEALRSTRVAQMLAARLTHGRHVPRL